jgi:hypothetical protein
MLPRLLGGLDTVREWAGAPPLAEPDVFTEASASDGVAVSVAVGAGAVVLAGVPAGVGFNRS